MTTSSSVHSVHPGLVYFVLGIGDSDVLLDLLKPQNADKILIKIADLGNACWVVSDCFKINMKNIQNHCDVVSSSN